MSRSLILALSALALVGCDTTDAPALRSASDGSAPYLSQPMDHGQRLVPAGQVLWSGPADGSAYDSTNEQLVNVGAMWVDTVSHREPLPIFVLVQQANARSRAAGLDTVYQWERLVQAGEFDSLVGLQQREANGFRIPTPQEAKYLMWGGRMSLPASLTEVTLWADPDSTATRNELGIPVANHLAVEIVSFNAYLTAYQGETVCQMWAGASSGECFRISRVQHAHGLLVRSAD